LIPIFAAMQFVKKITTFLKSRSRLDLFLIKAGTLVVAYYMIRIAFKFLPFLRPVFIWARKLISQVILTGSEWILELMGYDVNIHKKILWITGSQGVKIINACLGWSMMAMYIGFLIIYPGNKISKYWYIPLGLIIIQFANIVRITAMALVSYHYYGLLDFYHKYVFNIFLYLAVFILWIIWVRKFGSKQASS
jgi:exosortase/archaeosortase family protein